MPASKRTPSESTRSAAALPPRKHQREDIELEAAPVDEPVPTPPSARVGHRWTREQAIENGYKAQAVLRAQRLQALEDSRPEARAKGLARIAAKQLAIASGDVRDAPAAAMTAAARAYWDWCSAEEERERSVERSQAVDWEAIGQLRRDAVRAVLRQGEDFSRHVLDVEGGWLAARVARDEPET